MKIRAQIGMVLNLDKCIGCHTCSVTCKNVWTSRDGVEYAWFNNVETKPGIGYPKQWENQDKWNGGWRRTDAGKLEPRQGSRLKILAQIFANPNLPQIDEYYEPFTYDYERLQNAPLSETPPTARPISVITGKKMDKIEWGPNWEDDLGGEFAQRSQDALFNNMQKEMYGTFENTFCYPRIEAGQPTVCSETCVGRIRYLGVLLYDADKIESAASVADPRDLYPSQLGLFLDPHDPAIIDEARRQGIPDSWLESAKRSPVYKMAVEWKVAFPLHPEYRTLPMVWYIPPLSPIQAAAESGRMGRNGILPDTASLRIPVQYLANLLTAGDQRPVITALDRMLAMRAYMRSKHVAATPDLDVLKQVGLEPAMVEDMYHIMAIANYEDRFVIPSSHKEMAEDSFNEKGSCGFSFGNGCSDGVSDASLFGKRKHGSEIFMSMPKSRKKKENLDV